MSFNAKKKKKNCDNVHTLHFNRYSQKYYNRFVNDSGMVRVNIRGEFRELGVGGRENWRGVPGV